MTSATRHLRVVVFSDVVDSSERIVADELIGIQHIREDLALLQDLLHGHGGALVKKLGDGLLATFDAPSQALEFVQEASLHLSRRGGRSLQHRFGLHTGEIYADGDDILGLGVHLASRLQTISPANGVAFVQSTFDIIDDRFRACAELLGEVNLHGFRRPMVCYMITAEAFLQLDQRVALEPAGASRGLLERLLADTPFRPERRLGRSGNTSSFLVRDGIRDRRAVFKLFPFAPEFKEPFEREATCLERLRHPRIPRFLDAYERDGWFCLLQEYIAGPSLLGSLDYVGHPDRVVELMRQLLDILVAAHGAGVIHGDINPDSLIVSVADEQVYLVDFALMGARLTTSGQRPLDPRLLDQVLPSSLRQRDRPRSDHSYFRAPELVRFARLGPGADLFALGVTALVLATGRAADELYELERGAWSLEGLAAGLRERLVPLLEESPARRLGSVAEALPLFAPSAALDPAPDPAREAQAAAPEAEGGPVLGPKAALLEALAVHYGPVVELLLEAWPSPIRAGHREAIRTRLLAAGLDAQEVEQAFTRLLQAGSTGGPPGPVAAGSAAGSAAASSAGSLAEPSLDHARELLRQEIGPVVELIWSDDLARCLREDQEAAAGRLRGSFVPEPVIARLLATLQQRRPEPPPAPQAPPAPQDAGPPALVPPVAHRALRSALLDVVGPMGERIFETVESLPPADQLGATLETLRAYGISDTLLADFALRVLRAS